jgi:putative ABC transport system permease protein
MDSMVDVKDRTGVFNDLPQDTRHALSLPWERTLRICWGNINNRRGRFTLVFVGIAVVVAFFVNSFQSQELISNLIAETRVEVGEIQDENQVHIAAELEKVGLMTHGEDAEAKQAQQRIWLMTLSGLLCLVGITNTMLMSVTERVREIGTLKCLGALDGFIVRLFMIESIFIGLVGSILGAVLGSILTLGQVGLQVGLELLGQSGWLVVTFQGLVVAVVGGTGLTVLAALYPTWYAKGMKPVDAMRREF